MTFRINVTTICLSAHLAIFACSARGGDGGDAEIIWDNGGPFEKAGSLASDFRFPAQFADDFLSDGAHTIARVRFWGQYYNQDTPAVDQFTIRIFENVSSSPALEPMYEAQIGNSAARVNSGPVSFGHNTYQYDASLPPIALPAGTYWLSIVNDTTIGGGDYWYWSRASDTVGDVHYRTNDAQAWQYFPFGTGSTVAFVLQTPEPTIALTALMCVPFMLRSRKNG